MAKSYLNRLTGQPTERTPAWLMRQAGRYLSEYRALRATAGGFWDLVYNPEFAAEVTLQPIRRFDLDAAILFSDILVVPHALGHDVMFTAGEGPSMPPITGFDDLKHLNPANLMQKAAPVCETVARVKSSLPGHVTMIGFAGAPWTVAAYMLEGHGSRDFLAAKVRAHQNPQMMDALLDILVATTATYCVAQIKAGAEVIQLFDSWAGVLNEQDFQNWVIKPTRQLVQLIREQAPDVPIIGFPRGGNAYLEKYIQATKVTALQMDTTMHAALAQKLGAQLPVQGWLDPALLVAGGEALDIAVDQLKETMQGLPWLFNLGHGIVPQTPPEHVVQLLERLRT